MVTIKNNFDAYKSDFKKDTGLDFNPTNMQLYIAYFKARTADTQMQISVGVLQSYRI